MDDIVAEDGVGVGEEYLQVWGKHFMEWAEAYDTAFDRDLNEPRDFSTDVFQDRPEEKRAWAIQGMLLAVWLAMLPTVEGVQYSPGYPRVLLRRNGEGEESIESHSVRIVGLF